MSTRIRVATQVRQIQQDDANRERRLTEDAAARSQERAGLASQLADVEAKLAALPSAAGRPYEDVAAELSTAEKNLDSLLAESREAGRIYDEARAARQAEELRVNNGRETELAALLFQGIKPRHCPRCEQSIELARNELEDSAHECSVCTRPFPTAEADTGDEGEPEVDGDGLEALKQAEGAARDSSSAAVASVVAARAAVDQLAEELRRASRSDEFTNRLALQLDQARLRGHIDGLPETNASLEHSNTRRVLEAVVHVLTQETSSAAAAMFADLNTEILTLGKKFGISNLEAVELTGQGGMKVKTAGVEVPFKDLTGGERLRLRVAVIVALLRVGHRAGVGSHPGLVLLDSPGSDELTVADEATLLRELDSLRDELPSLQVIIASAEPAAVQGHLRESSIYASLDGSPLW